MPASCIFRISVAGLELSVALAFLPYCRSCYCGFMHSQVWHGMHTPQVYHSLCIYYPLHISPLLKHSPGNEDQLTDRVLPVQDVPFGKNCLLLVCGIEGYEIARVG